MVRLFMFSTLVFGLSSCASQVTEYADKSPKFVAEDFFSGNLSAHGVVKDFKGKVIRTFNADIDASWEGKVGTLDERFEFDDGEVQRRVWTLKPATSEKQGVQRYIGTASDVVGEANIAVAGNSMMLKYVLRIERDSGSLDVVVDDKMYLVDNNTVINESKLKKFGLPVGEIVLVIEKKDD